MGQDDHTPFPSSLFSFITSLTFYLLISSLLFFLSSYFPPFYLYISFSFYLCVSSSLSNYLCLFLFSMSSSPSPSPFLPFSTSSTDTLSPFLNKDIKKPTTLLKFVNYLATIHTFNSDINEFQTKPYRITRLSVRPDRYVTFFQQYLLKILNSF